MKYELDQTDDKIKSYEALYDVLYEADFELCSYYIFSIQMIILSNNFEKIQERFLQLLGLQNHNNFLQILVAILDSDLHYINCNYNSIKYSIENL